MRPLSSLAIRSFHLEIVTSMETCHWRSNSLHSRSSRAIKTVVISETIVSIRNRNGLVAYWFRFWIGIWRKTGRERFAPEAVGRQTAIIAVLLESLTVWDLWLRTAKLEIAARRGCSVTRYLLERFLGLEWWRSARKSSRSWKCSFFLYWKSLLRNTQKYSEIGWFWKQRDL